MNVSEASSSSQRGVDVLLDVLEGHGVRYVFGNPGTTEQSLLAAVASKPSIEYILGLHESVATAMADGFINLHAVPGVANALSQIYNAWQGHSPLLITAGQPSTRIQLNEPILGGNPAAMISQYCKWSVALSHASDILSMVRRGIKVALDVSQGPVFLGIPMDVLDESTSNVTSKAPIPVRRENLPDPDYVAQAAQVIMTSTSPVILCGDDVGRSGNNAVSALVRLAELIGAPVYATAQAQVNFPNVHSQFVRTLHTSSPATRQLLAQFDVIVAVGTPLFSQYLYLPTFIDEASRVVHFDESGWEVGKNVRVDVPLVGSLDRCCSAVADAIEGALSGGAFQGSIERIELMIQKKKDAAQRLAAQIDAGKGDAISSLRLMATLRTVVPEDCILVEESPSSAAALARVFAFSHPESLFSARGGSMGWGLPGALGVQLGRPNRPVVAVIGDGAAQYSIQGLWTAARYRLPVKFVICNDRSYHILKVNMLAHLGGEIPDKFVGMDLVDPDIDFVKIAEGYGVEARRVSRSSDLQLSLTDAVASAGPQLVDVRIEHEPFNGRRSD